MGPHRCEHTKPNRHFQKLLLFLLQHIRISHICVTGCRKVWYEEENVQQIRCVLLPSASIFNTCIAVYPVDVHCSAALHSTLSFFSRLTLSITIQPANQSCNPFIGFHLLMKYWNNQYPHTARTTQTTLKNTNPHISARNFSFFT